ncbi:hypothetical protein HAX42_14505 [Enterococcus casseliflavus]|nr:hypothetical protein [Enterococcus casseliflavus]
MKYLSCLGKSKKISQTMRIVLVLLIGLKIIAPSISYATDIVPYVFLDETLRANLRTGAQTSYVQNTMQATIEDAEITQALGGKVGSETTISIAVPTYSLLTGNGNDWIARIAGNSWMGVTEYRQMYYGNSPSHQNAFSIGSIVATSSSQDISVENSNVSISNYQATINITIKRLKESDLDSYPLSITINNLILGTTVVAPNQDQTIFPPQNVENVTIPQVISTINIPTEKNVIGAPVTVRYVDLYNNNLADPEVLTGNVGDSWESETKMFDKYELLEIIGATEGLFTTSEQEIIYRYQPSDFNLIDITTTPITNWHKEDHVKLIDAIYYARASSSDMEEQIQVVFPSVFWQASEFIVIVRDVSGIDRSSWFEITNSTAVLQPRHLVTIRGRTGTPVFSGQLFVIEVYGKLGTARTFSANETGFFEFGTPTLSLAHNFNVQQEVVRTNQPIQKKAANLTVTHTDVNGNELTERQLTYGVPGDLYETEPKEFDGYSLKEVVGDVVGEFRTEEISHVNYIYEKQTGVLEIQSLDGFDFNFGEVKTSSKQQVVMSVNKLYPRIIISDYSMVTSWSLRVSATPFISSSGKELPIIDFSLFSVDIVETVHQGLTIKDNISISQIPSVIAEMDNSNNNEDGLTILQVGEIHENEIKAASLTLPSNTPIDTGDYNSSITWELVGDPTLGGE